ncbi:hypothetical protein IAC76_08995 [Spirochaetes bacterium]|uniref:Uncharacterized protein n=1 Tax=Candidatus Scatousia excrementipullorum TaxID=2840936 RepID=A0A9D9H0B8_9BACT|nr:hypothetical protein [Candidatus Scatousia excrementipullorum]
MSKPISKAIYKIAEKNDSTRIVIFTEYLKIDGEIVLPEKSCHECHEDILSLSNALVCRLKDYCECEDDNCDCNDYVCFKYDWLNVNIDEIVAFSILK